MKTFIKLLKILLPSFIPLLVFSLIAQHYKNADISSVNIFESLISYYRYMMPIMFVIAVIMQYLIIVPLWNKALAGGWILRLALLFFLIVICAGISMGISYAIWDENTGKQWLQNSIITITLMQIAFWCINIIVLSIISAFSKPVPKEKEAT